MSKERAITLLCQMYLPHFDDEEKEALTMGIEALEKQVAKKPVGFWYLPKCSVCNGMAGEGLRKFNYCPNCGQKIDWSEADE